MLGAIIYERTAAEQNINYIQLYIDYFARHNIELRLEYKDEVFKMERPDFAIVRLIAPEITKKLEDAGVRCFNNYNVSYITNDKALTYKFMAEKGIEIMDTYYTANDVDKFPVVIKPKNSHGGDRVFMVRSREELMDRLSLYPNGNYVIQQVASDRGKDLRVYVLGKNILCAMLRQSDKDFRSNYSLGGKASVYELSDKERAVVNCIIRLFDFDLVGIDFVFHNGKIVFNEIEDVVGSRMVYSCTDIDIAKIYSDYIIKEMTK